MKAMDQEMFREWLRKAFDDCPLLAKNTPHTINELCYILRRTDADFCLTWDTPAGHVEIPSVHHSFIKPEDLALKYLPGSYTETRFKGYPIHREFRLDIISPVAGYDVWAIERDKLNKPTKVNPYLFIASCGDFAIVSPYVRYQDGDIFETLEFARANSSNGDDSELCVVLLKDCYLTRGDAEAAFVEQGGEFDYEGF